MLKYSNIEGGVPMSTPPKHLWRTFRYESDGTYDGVRCPVQTWKCEHCQAKLDVPAESDPVNYEQTTCIVHRPHMSR